MSTKNSVETNAKPAHTTPVAPARATNAGTEPTEEHLDEEDDLDLADGEVESSGEHAGMGRGEKPRKLKSEEK